MLEANNFYSLTTATSIINSGTGGNSLSKPAGEEVASIIPGKKYSVYIPSAATFTTNFNSDLGGYTVFFYAKPNEGEVLNISGNILSYDGNSFTMTNEVGDVLDIPVRSERAHLFIVTVSDMEIGVFIDGLWDSIDSNTLSDIEPIDVSILAAGGILDHVGALRGILSTAKIAEMSTAYLTELPEPPETMKMFDSERDSVVPTVVSERIDVLPGEVREIIPFNGEPLAFKIEYSMTGEGSVSINGEQVESGMVLSGEPDTISIFSMTGCRLDNVVITEYHSSNMGAMTIAEISTDLSSGTPAPTHAHDDAACNAGETLVSLTSTANTLAGWFYATDGSPLPGVSMAGGVLTGTNLYVNGKPYTGQSLRDWYFLAKTGATTGEFVIDVPVHSLTATEESYSASRIDDLYESFFGNPTVSVQDESVSVSGSDAFLISTEWNIVTSG